MNKRKITGAAAGTIFFVLLKFLPPLLGLTRNAQDAAAVTLLMACFWIGEVIPIYATALFPIIFFPVFGILNTKQVTAPYGNRIVFLMMGGFMIAASMQKWKLHKRIALYTIKVLGKSPTGIILGFMTATAILSMWMSNSATAVMMVPIAISVIWKLQGVDGPKQVKPDDFSVALMLGIAYSASVGGMATLVGTPPNAVFAGQLKEIFPASKEIFFNEWMMFGLPVSIVMLTISWLFLTRIIFKVNKMDIDFKNEVINNEIKNLGKITNGEKVVLSVFSVTALLWMTRGLWANLLLKHGIFVHDSTIAIAAAVALFIIPVKGKKREYGLDWDSAKTIPWGVLLLFGGGFSLAAGLQASGFAAWVGGNLHGLASIHPIIMVFTICIMMTFLTEVTMNTSTTTIMMPVLAYAAVGLKIHPLLLMLPATLSASCAFMLPAATPPNAIVFGSGMIRLPQMARAGLALNIIGAVVVTLFVYFAAGWAFGIDLSSFPQWAADISKVQVGR